MFSVAQKREIANRIQQLLRETNHPELPEGEISFLLHVDGAESLTDSASVNFYENCDNCDFRIPAIKGIEDLQRSLDIFTAINKPFWRLGGDSAIGLCIINRALRKIECENADVHCLWYPTRQRIELTDRVWESLKLQNWKLIDGEWRAINQ
jgi:hypothetical protein